MYQIEGLNDNTSSFILDFAILSDFKTRNVIMSLFDTDLLYLDNNNDKQNVQ